MPGEGLKVKFEAVDSFVGTEVEERGVRVDRPLLNRDHFGTVVVGPVIGNDVHVAELLHFIQILIRPHSGDHKVSDPLWFEPNQILDNSSILHGGAALLKKNSIVIWDLQKLPDFVFGHDRDITEFILSVTKLHNRLTGSSVIKHLLNALFKHGLGQYAGSSGEVVSISTVGYHVLDVKALHVLFRVHVEVKVLSNFEFD